MDLISGAQLDEYLNQGKPLFLVDMRMNARTAGLISGEPSIFRTGSCVTGVWELPQDRLIVLYCYHGPNSCGRQGGWLPWAMRRQMCTADPGLPWSVS